MRRSIAVPFGPEGKRDAGKVFRITELHPEQFESWLGRAVLSLGQAGVTISQEMVEAGVAGLANLSPAQLQMVPWTEMEPLLAAMLPSFALVDSSDPASARPIKLGDVEELATLWRLRMEWIGLHLNPLGPASLAPPAAPAPVEARRPSKRRQGRGSRA